MDEDKDVQRLKRTELVLKKFGLLPKDFNLQTFLVGLLEEQVAGYYDSKTKTVNMLDWVEPDLQRPVLAHELTHALQDQSFGLDKWLKKDSEDLDTKKNLTADDITKDENSEARQAVVEGQAMVVLLDYMLAAYAPHRRRLAGNGGHDERGDAAPGRPTRCSSRMLRFSCKEVADLSVSLRH